MKKSLCAAIVLFVASAVFAESVTLFTTDNGDEGSSILTIVYDRNMFDSSLINKVHFRLLSFDKNKNQILKNDTYKKGTVTLWGGDELLLNGSADWNNGAIESEEFEPDDFFYLIKEDLSNITEVRFNVAGEHYNFIRADAADTPDGRGRAS